MTKRHALPLALALIAGVIAGVWMWKPSPEKPTVDLRRFQPKAVHRIPPEIPESMRLPDRAAEITAKVTVKPDGTVADVAILSSDIPAANTLVIDACRKWVFEPAGIEQETMYHTRVMARTNPGR